MAAKGRKPKPDAVVIHMPGQYTAWEKATGRMSMANAAVPSQLGATFSAMPTNGWEIIDAASGGDPRQGVNAFYWVGLQGGKIDNNLRFSEEDLFIPTSVGISKVGPIQAWCTTDTGPPIVPVRYPQNWTQVPFLQEVVYVTTDSRILDNWQGGGSPPINNPMAQQFFYAGRMGEQPVTGIVGGGVIPLMGEISTPLSKILYGHSITYAGGNQNSAFQAISKDVWGGAQQLAAQSLYWVRAYMWMAESNEGTGNETTYVKIPDMNLTLSGIREDSATLPFIMGLRQNLGATQ